MRRPFVAGNWKMNKTPSEARVLAQELRTRLANVTACDIAVFPVNLAITNVAEVLKGSNIAVGGQNLFWEKSGAFTGATSGAMLVDCGCQYVLTGHSERRQYFHETDERVNKRTKAGLANGLKVIVCVGETREEREGNVTEKVVRTQIEGAFEGLTAADMAGITIAYEPVWAIGTGLTATPDQAQAVHAFIRELVKTNFGASVSDALRIQYGGSVNAKNAAELLSKPDIDGALVGGASLKAEDFEVIVRAAK